MSPSACNLTEGSEGEVTFGIPNMGWKHVDVCYEDYYKGFYYKVFYFFYYRVLGPGLWFGV